MNKITGIMIAIAAVAGLLIIRYFVPDKSIDNSVEIIVESAVKAETGIDIDPIIKSI